MLSILVYFNIYRNTSQAAVGQGDDICVPQPTEKAPSQSVWCSFCCKWAIKRIFSRFCVKDLNPVLGVDLIAIALLPNLHQKQFLYKVFQIRLHVFECDGSGH